MKNRTKKVIYGSGVAIAIFAVIIAVYMVQDRNPEPCPNHDHILRELNQQLGKDKATHITDVILLEERFAFVPYRTIDGNAGKSFWEWKKLRWNLNQIQTTGDPVLWSLDGRNPAKMYLIYSMNPLDEIEEIRFYYIRGRSARSDDGAYTYLPRIQMESSVSLQPVHYGAQLLPEAWYRVMKEVNTSNNSINIGWIPYNGSGEVSFPKRSIYGSIFNVSDNRISNLYLLDEEQLEWLP